jgi:uncharacterized membrane protein YhaH (DUF805 family)
MKPLEYFFNPYGRLPRLDYAMSMAAMWAIICVAGEFGGMRVVEPLALFLVFPSFCLGSRRWHDFNRSGFWWFLRFATIPAFALMPSIYTYFLVQVTPLVMLLVECIVPGSVAANRFGPAPVGIATRFKARRRSSGAGAATTARRATPMPVAAKKASRPKAKSAKPKPTMKKKKK